MIPLRVYLEGFLSYARDEQGRGETLLFDGASLWVLAGRNGAGKSAVFDAITYALYGFHRGGGQDDVDLINHQCDSFVVEFDFLLDGTAYRVRRTVSRRGRKTWQVLRLLTVDGHERVESIAGTDSDAGLRRWVEKTLGLDYRAFTSSVLLLQGKSERLIEADPRHRHGILSQIIDLAPYQRLHQAVDERRKEYAQQVKALDAQLSKTPTVSDAELVAAGEAVAAAEEEYRRVQDKVDRLTELVGHSRQWEALTDDLNGRQEELTCAQALLDRADEIQRGFDRWRELDDVVPNIEAIARQGERLGGYVEQITRLGDQIQEIEDKLAEAEEGQRSADTEAERLGKEVERLQQEATTLANRLLELAPLVLALEQLQSTERELVTLDEALDKLPADLDRKVEEAEECDRQLEAAGRAESWLKDLAAARLALVEAQEKAEQARASQEAADAEIEGRQIERDRLSCDVEEARQAENRLAHEVTVAQTRCKDAAQRRDRFARAATQPVCSLCGQPIMKEHAAEEQTRLEAEVKNAEADFKRVKQEHTDSAEHLRVLSSDLTDLDTQLAELAGESTKAANALIGAGRDTQAALSRARLAFSNLPDAYQDRVAPEAPTSADGWLAAFYPTEDDLANVRREAGSRTAHQRVLRELKKQHTGWQGLEGQRKGIAERIEDLKGRCPVEEAKQAREETGGLTQRKLELNAELMNGQRAHEVAKAAAATAGTGVKAVRGQLDDCNRQLTAAGATREEVERSRMATLQGLPETWRDPAANAGRAELAAWRAERDELAHYEREAKELLGARQKVGGLIAEIGKLQKRADELPDEAHRPTREVEAELSTAKACRDDADGCRQVAQSKHSQLEEQRRQRADLEGTRRTADRQRHLHELLANLLGPSGLQHRLLRRAEGEIVRLANEVLDGLSRGRMRLELRSTVDSGKALDLVVYNLDTGPKPIAVALASGSQRFRIAVSLALAVGRYAGMEARRVESVIIDEGFGSLDKAGRDDMIQQLNDLKEQLARVILVSHQEEFTGAFVNGYTIELVNGASHVSPLEQA